MRKILTLIVCSAYAMTAICGQRSDDEMMRIALSKLNSATMAKAISGKKAVLQRAQPALSTSTYTIFTPTNGNGLVIVSRNESYPAILGYSANSFDANHIPCCMKWWLDELDRQMADKKSAPKRFTPNGGYSPIAPFITTKWGQGDPFNRKTPTIKGEHTPVGCVATAMAQAMNYCQWPKSAKFDSYYILGDAKEGTEVSVNSTYSWPYKDGYGYFYLDGYTDRNDVQYVEPGRLGNLVAQLCVDCGYAVNMHYQSSGSGTYNFLAAAALIDFFNYPEECVKYASRSSMADEDWYSLIYYELQHKSPIVFGGQDEESGGHAFVLGGIDADGLVYVNWGWNGELDGFYDVSLLNTTTYEFSGGHDIVYGIRTTPLPTDKVEPRVYSYDGEPYTFVLREEEDAEGTSHIALHIMFNRGMINFSSVAMMGEFGIFGSDLTDNCNWQIIETDPDTLESQAGWYLYEPAALFYYYVEEEMIPGHTYRISFGTRDVREGEWHSIVCNGGEVGYDIYYTGDPETTTISERKGALLVGVNDIRGEGVAHCFNQTRVYDLQGRLVYSRPTKSFNLWDVPARGTLIVKEGDKVRKVVR